MTTSGNRWLRNRKQIFSVSQSHTHSHIRYTIMLRTLLNDENGFVISAELMLVITLMFCAAAVGWAAVRDALVNELNDVSHAIGAVSQSYNVTGFKKEKDIGKPHGECSGFGFNDDADECDCKIIEYVDVCGKNDPSTGADE